MKRAPRARLTDAERLKARNITRQKLNDTIKAINPAEIFKSVTQATIIAQKRLEDRYNDYLEELDANTFPDFDYESALTVGSGINVQFWCGFLSYVASVGLGQINEYPSIRTMKVKVGVLLGLISRRTQRKIPSEVSKALYHYVDGKLKDELGLKDDVRAKNTADLVDVGVLHRQAWDVSNPLVSKRMIIQVAAFINIACRAGSRPGSIVESSAYKGSNEALAWGDIKFFIVPPKSALPDAESDECIGDKVNNNKWTTLAVQITFRYLKGMRNNNSKFLKILFVLDMMRTGFAHCACSQLLYLGLADNVFEHVRDLTDLTKLMHNTKTTISLKVKQAARTQAVLRAFANGKKDHVTISETEAMSYDSLYFQFQRLGLKAGFSENISLYVLRRMTLNNLDDRADVTAEQTKQIMGHHNLSSIKSVYMSGILNANLSDVAEGRPQDKTESRLSVCYPRMPTEMRQLHYHLKERKRYNYGSVKKAQGTEEGAVCTATWKELSTVYKREARVLFREERMNYFEDAGQRLLDRIQREEAAAIEPITILPDDDETDPDQLDLGARQQAFGGMDFNNPTPFDMAKLCEPYASDDAQASTSNTALASEPITPIVITTCKLPRNFAPSNYPHGYEQHIFSPPRASEKQDSIDAWAQTMSSIASLPEKKVVKRFNTEIRSHPGEEPTSDGNCQWCSESLLEKTLSDQARHLHQCATERRQMEADEAYDKRFLNTEFCGLCDSKMDPNLDIKVKHIQKCAKARGQPKRVTLAQWTCNWNLDNKNGCNSRNRGHNGCSELMYTMAEYYAHIDDVHGGPAIGKGFMHFCQECHHTIMSHQEEEEHAEFHFRSKFAPLCGQGNPYLYGSKVNTGLVERPGYCPVCVWDESLPFSRRLHQFWGSNGAEQHFTIHHLKSYIEKSGKDLDKARVHSCPAGECNGSTSASFTLLELYNHLIQDHRLTFGGKIRKEKGKLAPMTHWNQLSIPFRPWKGTPEYKALGLVAKKVASSKALPVTESANKKENVNPKRPAPDTSPKPTASGSRTVLAPASPSSRPKKRGKKN
ncbi:hypothetical protein PM082_020550 [Marasmius tenuissimus]|nr:hypothetical protein PM082_020550 [Marasmius tenuissimus]